MPVGIILLSLPQIRLPPRSGSKLKNRFTQEVLTHYNFLDRQQGYIMAMNADGQLEQTPLMSLAIWGCFSQPANFFRYPRNN